MPAFLAALQDAGWIRRGEPVEASRLWGLLQGPPARAPRAPDAVLDRDLAVLQAGLEPAGAQQRETLPVEAMSPALHWTPAGLAAAREFCAQRFR